MDVQINVQIDKTSSDNILRVTNSLQIFFSIVPGTDAEWLLTINVYCLFLRTDFEPTHVTAVAIATAHVIVLTVEINSPFLWIATPAELPVAIKTDDFLARLPFRGQLQRCVIRQFINTQYGGILPVVGLCLR